MTNGYKPIRAGAAISSGQLPFGGFCLFGRRFMNTATAIESSLAPFCRQTLAAAEIIINRAVQSDNCQQAAAAAGANSIRVANEAKRNDFTRNLRMSTNKLERLTLRFCRFARQTMRRSRRRQTLRRRKLGEKIFSLS